MYENVIWHAERKHRLNGAWVVAQEVMQLNPVDAQAGEQRAKGCEIAGTVVAKAAVGAGIITQGAADREARLIGLDKQRADPSRPQPGTSLPDKALDSSRQPERYQQHDILGARGEAFLIEAAADRAYWVGGDAALDEPFIVGMAQAQQALVAFGQGRTARTE
jgi:hypothetical protein